MNGQSSRQATTAVSCGPDFSRHRERSSHDAPLFRYTPRDAWPALGGVAIVALHVVTFVGQSHWPFALRAAAFLALAYSYWCNLQWVSHDFTTTRSLPTAVA